MLPSCSCRQSLEPETYPNRDLADHDAHNLKVGNSRDPIVAALSMAVAPACGPDGAEQWLKIA
jgi:hypothetical protein